MRTLKKARMALLLNVLLVLEMALCVESASSGTTEEFWFSTYGEVDYGRPLSEGVNIGTMSTIQCSIECAEDASCAAVEFDGSSGRIGPCYKFPTMTHNGRMISAPGHKYFEKRSCMKVHYIDAVVVFQDAARMIIFTENKVIMYELVLWGNGMHMKYVASGDIAMFFPTVTPFPVQAAFQGVTPESIYILAGGLLHYYVNVIPGTILIFSPSTPTDVLTPFLTTHTGDVTAITCVSADRTQLHLMDGDTFYKLQWNAGTSKYDTIGSFSRFDPSEMWSKLPDRVTGLARALDNTNYAVTEGHKLYLYHTGTKVIEGIILMCNYP